MARDDRNKNHSLNFEPVDKFSLSGENKTLKNNNTAVFVSTGHGINSAVPFGDDKSIHEKFVESHLNSTVQTSDDKVIHEKFVESHLNSAVPINDDKSIHEKFIEYGRNAKEWMRKCVFLLPEIEKRKIWQKKGFSSLFEYAAKLAGMSRHTVEDSLRILRKIKDKPAIAQVAMKKGINCIRPVLTIVTKENEKYWAEKARSMSKNTLSVFVKGLRGVKKFNDLHQQAIFNESGRTGPAKNIHPGLEDLSAQEASRSGSKLTSVEKASRSDFKLAPAQRTTVFMELNPETAEKLEKLKGNGAWEDLMSEFIKMREARIEAEKPVAVKTKSRHIPNPIKRHVLAKTKGLCAFPGCKKTAEILHHTKRFSLNKKHDPDFIVGLCKSHERLAHLGLIENEDGPPEKWKIREKPDEEYLNSDKFMIDEMVNRFRIRMHPG